MCQEGPAVEEADPKKTCNIDGSVKDTCASLDVALTIHVHCNSLNPVLTEGLLMALHFRDPQDLMKYCDLHDWIHLDEKWFFLTWEKEKYLLLLEEKTQNGVLNTNCTSLR